MLCNYILFFIYVVLHMCVLSFLSIIRNGSQYELRLSASDNKNENSTTVVIQVRDVNGKFNKIFPSLQ